MLSPRFHPRLIFGLKCLLFVGLLQAEPVAIADVNFLLYLAEMEDVDGEMVDPMEMSNVDLEKAETAGETAPDNMKADTEMKTKETTDEQ